MNLIVIVQYTLIRLNTLRRNPHAQSTLISKLIFWMSTWSPPLLFLKLQLHRAIFIKQIQWNISSNCCYCICYLCHNNCVLWLLYYYYFTFRSWTELSLKSLHMQSAYIITSFIKTPRVRLVLRFRDLHINQKKKFVWLCVISEIVILKSQKFAF